MMDSGKQSKDTYEEEVRASLRTLASRLKQVETGVENSAADIRIKNQKELDDLSWRLKELETRLEELLASDESAWKELRARLDASLTEMTRDIENAFRLVEI